MGLSSNEETCMLPVKLTDMERDERGRQLARFEVERETFEAAAKTRAAADKARLADMTNAISLASKVVDTGQETRPVTCLWLANERLRTMRLVRTDTHETVRTRPMTAEEQQEASQGDLQFDPPRNSADAQTAGHA